MLPRLELDCLFLLVRQANRSLHKELQFTKCEQQPSCQKLSLRYAANLSELVTAATLGHESKPCMQVTLISDSGYNPNLEMNFADGPFSL